MLLNNMSSTTNSYFSDTEDEHDFNLYDLLYDRYMLIEKLGKGSYAHVWIVFDLITHSYYALKVFNPDDYKIARKESFLYELFNKSLDCSHIINCINSFDINIKNETYHCCVLELMGCALNDFTKTRKYAKGFNYKTSIKLIRQILTGLNELHKNGFIHGDIKPDNILVSALSKNQKDLIRKLNIDTELQTYMNKLTIKNKKKKKNKSHTVNIEELYEYLLNKIHNVIDNDDNNTETNTESNTEINIDTNNQTNNIIHPLIIKKYIKENKENNSRYFTDILYDSDIDDECVSLNSEDYHNDNNNEIDNDNNEFEESYIDIGIDMDDEFTIKISDFGLTIHPSYNLKKEVQTCYYQSPEILLGLSYDSSCDIWAIGCMMYEFLTGNILFDAYDYDNEDNKDRIQLSQFVSRLGPIPNEMINQTFKKDLYFSKDCKRIKGINKHISNNLGDELFDIFKKQNINEEIILSIIDFMKITLQYDKQKRPTCEELLKHDIFTHL